MSGARAAREKSSTPVSVYVVGVAALLAVFAFIAGFLPLPGPVRNLLLTIVTLAALIGVVSLFIVAADAVRRGEGTVGVGTNASPSSLPDDPHSTSGDVGTSSGGDSSGRA